MEQDENKTAPESGENEVESQASSQPAEPEIGEPLQTGESDKQPEEAAISPAEIQEDERTKDQRIMDDFARQIEERKSQDTKAKRRNWWIKTGLLLLLIGLSIYMLFPITKGLTGEGTKGFSAMVRGASLKYFLILVCVVLGYIIFESFQYSYILKTSTGKFRIRNSIKVAFLGKYYDGITPLGTGGQPFQIYYLHKKDIPAGIATATPLLKYTFSTFAKGVLSVIFFSLTFILLPAEVTQAPTFTAVYVIAWISMVFNMLVPVVMIFGSLFPRAGKKLIIRIINLLSKMHIVKRKYKVTKKYVTEMSEYRRALKEILHRWWIVIPLGVICLITAVLNFSVPYFTSLALASVTPTMHLWLQMLCGGFLVYYSASLIPTPGNSGAIETTSTLVFASVLSSVPGGEGGALAVWIIIVWRFFNYYMYIFSGIGISIFEIIRSAVRNKRALKNSQK